VINEIVEYGFIDDEQTLIDLVSLLSKEKAISIDTETTGLRPLEADLVGIGLGIQSKQAWYIPVNQSIGLERVIELLTPLFENPQIYFYGHNIKYDLHILQSHGVKNLNLCFDTLLASYLLNSHSRQHSLDYLALEIFDKVKIPIEDLIGKGKNQITMADVPLEKITRYCCEDVDYTVRLKELLAPQIEERGMHALYYNLELPLLSILAKMEERGIYVDSQALRELGMEIEKEIAILTESIYSLAGEPFNLNSPKQLSQILFDKLQIPPPKKTATGYSTNADVLEGLKGTYPIAGKLLEYRTLEKLRSTYVETLPLQINQTTQRIHCTFNQSGTATGRLACQDPNLQNIPVRTAIGRKIREAFRPQKEGWSYLSADYSQIELRLLAHFSEDENLVRAFNENEDVHTFTASLIFNIPLNEVTPEQRYQAKAVNFGIMYGQQAFGLSQELGVDPKTAATFIQMYFERYGKVKQFIESCKLKAKETGKAVTLYGRERLIPEIRSSNAILRNMAERLAVNTPIQGTQADLIKMAMLEVNKQLSQQNLKSFMILQIHDELIFEVPNEEIEMVSSLVHKAMTEVISLKIPLIVDIHVGKNWKEC
jgi:DNA polymerase-1